MEINKWFGVRISNLLLFFSFENQINNNKAMKKLFTLLALVVLSMAVHAQKYHNDVNKDGMANVSDVTCQVNKMLGAPNLGDASYPGANRTFLLNYPNFRQKVGGLTKNHYFCSRIEKYVLIELVKCFCYEESSMKSLYGI